MLSVVIRQQVGVDVGVVGAGLTGEGAGDAVGDDVGLLRLLAIHIDRFQGDLAHDVNVVICVLHSHTDNKGKVLSPITSFVSTKFKLLSINSFDSDHDFHLTLT